MINSQCAIARSDMIRCALCADAPCDAACDRLNPASLLRSVWFLNEQTAAQRLPDENPCLTCDAPCERACVRAGEVPIRDLMNRLHYQVKPDCETPLPAHEDGETQSGDPAEAPAEAPPAEAPQDEAPAEEKKDE